MELKIAKLKLKQILKNLENKNFEINLILTHVLKISLHKLLLNNSISNENFQKCKKIAIKRNSGKPLQHLLNGWNFYGVDIKLNSHVFIPRPETELLVDFAIKLKPKKIIDLCTGSGCLCAAIAKHLNCAKFKAIDISSYAIACAKKNTKNFKNRTQLIKGSVLNKKIAKNFNNWANLIICNPPYLNRNEILNMPKELKFEPKLAFDGDVDGLVFYRKICEIWKKSLNANGYLIFEIGHNQKHDVELILKKNNFVEIQTFTDYYGNNRIVVAKKN